ncbi:serine/threonine-protein kinase [Arthrobacter sp. ok362]|uniref:protein kinase domain-containing protein n=1 Tax=Arthrobacter sp. ok362 TaxID=1761745 RepID=UPI000882B65B|nr:serine/threonine-protein kinase [Arthrobacter sp. ok362]SDM06466.1 Serine/threonine protein kinase [Arthrobacter sp. ok362]
MEDLPAAGSAAPEVPGYDVGRLLGRGGTAAVWLVTERSTGREFALKCFDPGGEAGDGDGGTADREAEEAMRREVRILSALDHEHLLRAHTVLRLPGLRTGPDENGALGLVLDYAPGGSVADLIAGRGRLGAGETVTILTPIAQALQYLHSHGFTHGDVSPGNVLFTAHGKPLLADVGVARMVADAGAARLAGTEGFSDPAPVDAVRAGLQPDRDVYSLAALGWYCLTGRAPVPGAGRPPLPLLLPDVPAALAAALEAGLDEDRRKRPSAAELAAAVYRSAAAEPVDLSVTAHPTVIPQLLTRRAVQPGSGRRRPGHVRHQMAAARGFRRRKRLEPAAGAGHSRRSHPGTAGLRRRSGTIRAAGLHRGFRKTSARRAISLIFAAVILLAGTWLLAGGGLVRDTVGGLFPGLGADRSADLGAPVQSGPAVAEGTSAEPSGGPAGETPPVTADGGDSRTRPELEALLASADPAEAVRGLARLRSLALSSGDFSLLDDVNAPESAAAAADARIRTQLSGSGHVLAGFSTSLTRVETTADSSPSRAVVAITTASSAYQELDGGGNVVGEAPAAAAQQLDLVLVPVDGRWRIKDVLPPGPKRARVPRSGGRW